MKNLLLITFLLLASGAPIASASCNNACNTQNSCNRSCDSGDCCSCPCLGKTFFYSRPMYQSYRPELWSGFGNDRMEVATNGIGGALDFVLFGSKSTNAHNLASYFLPDCNNCLVTRERTTVVDPANLFAENFNIITVDGLAAGTSGFVSTSSFKAKQSVAGFGLHYKQGFLYNHENTKWWYVDISSSVQHINNQIDIHETIINDGGGAATAEIPQAVGSLTQALNQAAWNYGKIRSGCPMKKTGLADIEFKVGYQWWHEHCHYAGYYGLLIPTGNKAKGREVFEPIVGHGKYFGLMSGFEGDTTIWTSRCEKWHADFDFAANGMYLFRNTQVRSFDLKNKPWSRYIELYANQAQAEQAAELETTNPDQATYLSTPGINILTQPVHVTPGFSFNMTTALVVQRYCGFEATFGYNFFARQHECVKLKCPWQVGPAIKAAGGVGETNPIRNITGNALIETEIIVPLADYNESLILASDLDLNSASHPNIIANIFYLALGYNLDDRCVPLGFNAGASYEFSERNFAVMNRWALWAKFNIAF